MRIAILSRQPLLYSTNALIEAGRARGHDMQVMDTLRFDIGIRHRQPELFYNGQPVSGIDAVIPRIGASITFYGLAVVRQFEMMGIYCLNDSQAIARSRDKLRSLQLLARHNLGIPPTMFTRQAEHVPACIQRVEGPPVIVKLLEGTQGVGVVLAESERAASSVVEAFHGLDQNILIQQFIREAKGADTRVLVVGGKVVAAMKRQAKPGEFRSNLHRGGSSKKVRLSAEYRRCALTATKVLGLQLAGVDLIESGNGPMIMEVNSSPGLEGITKTSGIDVADAIIRYLESEVPPPEPPGK
ncbi:30S ribosomal protein S6--L-glutamate ligase [Tuwongella immobilis]|uniref:ATP-grasp domain-containing protein n=1 Tax=Tuwongella immobilis TaxID=692036 RepID=A0A6C2YHN9_9BACT|nr:30S ribosomal protein S6--L-glutamate ligase [Tuwongella immobilis]VIP01006.1 ribosomal protein s6 modification protein : Probable alpha-L-glutamate ligase OS=Pseudomonas resinovorans NBRC 106553 GN=rimK PE=3 SV=1: RimK [Tuwongella immobilis]VTR97436.1 ribosomal protein s6 modification protein : Probable alpha-L-glutamate ligase OS=Pseudomonas resinovorans NBRC 106553 GN=rimK PE=3 SV=1: RimK [Tuwongella immobilis]